MARAVLIFTFLFPTLLHAEESNHFLPFTGSYVVERSNCKNNLASGSTSVRIEEDSGTLKIQFRKNDGSVGIPLANGYNGLGCEMKLFATHLFDIKSAMALCYAADDMSSSTRIFKIEKRFFRYLLILESSRVDISDKEPTHDACTLTLIGS